MGIFSFRSKGEKDAKEELFRRRIDDQILKLLDKKDEERSLLETLSKEIQQNSTDIRKHDMALEDCLEMLTEQQEEKTQDRKRMNELEEEQNKLLKLLEVYQEQMWRMRKYASEHDPIWFSQLELSKEAVKGRENLCGITLIEEAGARLDYALHEVIEVRETADEGKAQTVAEVCEPGYIYRGVVKRKAKIIAYRKEDYERK